MANVQYATLHEPLTQAVAHQLAQQYKGQLYLTLSNGWDSVQALDALVAAFGHRLENLAVSTGTADFWKWLRSNPAMQNLSLPGSLIPARWTGKYEAPKERLYCGKIPETRKSLNLSVFSKVQYFNLHDGGHLKKLRLNGTATYLSLSKISADPDPSWASLTGLAIDSTKLDLAPLLAATPALTQLSLYWPVRTENLESLLMSRHWKHLNFVGPGVPKKLVTRLWEAKVADEIHGRTFPGPFQEETFANGEWEWFCTR